MIMSHSIIAPPTSNELNDLQKARLMRSTRKLAAVLGTTPYLLDPVDESESSEAESFSSCDNSSAPYYTDDRVSTPSIYSRSTSRASKREGRIFSSSSSMCSTSSLASWFSISDSDFYESSSSQSSVSSFHNITRPPVVPPSYHSSPVVKVSLPGLIPEKKISSKQANPLNLRLNPVLLSPSDNRFALTSPLLPPTPRSPESMVFASRKKATSPADRRKKMTKLYRTLGENVPPQLVFRGSATEGHDADDEDDVFTPKQSNYLRPRLPSFSRTTNLMGSTVSHGRSLSTPQLLSAGTASVVRRGPFRHVRQSTTAFAELHTRCETPDSVRSHATTSWEGQWNVHDIANVQKALRTLRA
jgi:hypothetical protein